MKIKKHKLVKADVHAGVNHWPYFQEKYLKNNTYVYASLCMVQASQKYWYLINLLYEYGAVDEH